MFDISKEPFLEIPFILEVRGKNLNIKIKI